jgi:hypothetical protein
MRSRKNTSLTFSVFAFLLLAGCALKETPYSPSQAEKQFIKIAKEEHHLNAVLKSTGKTLWIYFPLEHDLFLIKAGQEEPKNIQKKMSLEYLDGAFKDNVFSFQYDIVPVSKSTKNNGMNTGYTEDFSKAHQGAINAVTRAFLETKEAPEFIVLVFADIKNGLEVNIILYLQDLVKYQTGALPYEEYQNRVLTETRGSQEIIGDNTGAHINYQEIAFPGFIVKQIINKVTFKYQRSDFAPDEDTEREILKIIQSTFTSYQMTDFKEVQLEDLRSDTHRVYSPALLSSFAE